MSWLTRPRCRPFLRERAASSSMSRLRPARIRCTRPERRCGDGARRARRCAARAARTGGGAAPAARDRGGTGRRGRTAPRVLDQLDDYLLPRLRDPGAPVLVVVGGSTGAGKSTVVNSLVGAEVSPSGVLRPTTRWPVLVHHPLDVRWFSSDRVLPSLTRADAAGEQGLTGARPGLRLVASEAVPVGLALLDAPDVDSVEEGNRVLAAQLLGAADVWLFVTTAARYADAVPWELLPTRHGAGRTSRSCSTGWTRRRDGGGRPPAADARRRRAGLGHGHRRPGGRAGGRAAARGGGRPIADVLTRTATDPAVRAAALAETWDGAVADVSRRALDLASAADEQQAADARLRAAVTAAYATARATRSPTRRRTGRCCAARCWRGGRTCVGTSEWFRSLEQGVSRLRDRVVGFVRGRRPAEPALVEAVAHGLSAVIQDAAEEAAETAHSAWRHDPAGRALLDGLALSRASADLRARTAEQVRAWQGDVLGLVETEGADRRTAARALSYGVNGLGAVLMVAVFASTGGLTGAEVGIVGGSALLAQRVLEAVFGDEAVRRLTQEAHDAARRPRGRAAGRGVVAVHPSAGRGGRREPGRRRPARGGRPRAVGDVDADRRDRLGSRRAPGRRRRAPARDGRRRAVGRGGGRRGAASAPGGGHAGGGEPGEPGRPARCAAPGRGAGRGRRARARTAARRHARRARRGGGPRPRPCRAVRRVHGGRARGGHGLREVVAAQRARGRAHRGARRAPTDDGAPGGRDRPGEGRCTEHGADELLDWLDVRDRHVARQPGPAGVRDGPACSSTCPTTTPSSPSTARSPSACTSGWTCWSGWWTRRSTPTRPCTPGTCAACATTPASWSWCSTRRTGWRPPSSARWSRTCSGSPTQDGLGASPVLAVSALDGRRGHRAARTCWPGPRSDGSRRRSG